MLTEADVDWIKANRNEITENRTKTVTLIHAKEGSTDPYTGEPTGSGATYFLSGGYPASYEQVVETVEAVWEDVSTVAGERSVVGGVELRQDDVQMTVDIAVILTDVETVRHDGVDYVIVAADERGLGENNRRECIVRQAV